MKRAFVDTPEGQVHYCYEGSGEPLLMLHQTPRSSDQYRDLMPLLAKSRRAIAMDTVGYGDSYKPEGQPAIQDYAKAAISLLDSLNIETTCILGQHTGTMIATELAAAYPDRVDKLILYGPPYFDDQVVQVLQARRPGMTDWQTKDDGSHLKELWDAIKDRAIQQGWPQVPSQLVNRHVLEALKAGEDYSDLGRNAVVNYTRNLDERMKAIQCPTLIIWGTHDILELPKENKAMPGKLIPRNRVVELEGGTYMAMHQMPDKIAQLVLDFLANPGV